MKRKFILASVFAMATLVGIVACSKDDETSDPQQEQQEQKDQQDSNSGSTGNTDKEDNGATTPDDGQSETKTFKVTINGTSQEVEEGAKITLPAADEAYSKVVYKCGDTEYSAGDEITVTSDMEFTATYYYKLTFSDGTSEEVEAGAEYTFAANTAKYKVNDYTFDGKTYSQGDKVAISKSCDINVSSHDEVTMDELADYLKEYASETEDNVPSLKTTITDYTGAAKDTITAKNAFANYYFTMDLTLKANDSFKALPDYAFCNAAELKSITLPDNLESIGIFAFYNCSSLAEINIPSGTKEIKDYAFCACTKLEEVELPEGLETIGSYSFLSCIALTSIEFPQTLKYIGNYSFFGANNLSGSIIIYPNVEEIGRYAFYSTSLTSAKILYVDEQPTVGYNAFPSTCKVEYSQVKKLETKEL